MPKKENFNWEAELDKIASAHEAKRGEVATKITELSAQAIEFAQDASPADMKALETAAAALDLAVRRVKANREFAANNPLDKALDDL